MTERKGGLGRGLGALIPTGPATPEIAAVEGARFAELPIDAIVPNAVQPRQVFDEDALSELVHSIREVGLLQPVVVRPLGGDRYELIMGERRWRASQRVGLTVIPAIVRETPDTDMLRDALLENLHRSQLNPLEEAAAYQQLLADFGVTHEELAQRIGRSRPQISNTIRLLGLPGTVQSKLAAGVLSAVLPERHRKQAAKRLVPEAAREVAEQLSDRLETRVKVDVGARKGRITIDFATLEDLQRVADIINGPRP
jgi:ParB family chromosome partitioning protein